MTAPFKWPRKLTKAKLRERGIFNTYGFLRDGEPCISYSAGGGTLPRGWHVNGPAINFLGPWYERGGKTFGIVMSNRVAALAAAQEFAGKAFNVAEWVRTPFGSYVPREVAERVAGGGE